MNLKKYLPLAAALILIFFLAFPVSSHSADTGVTATVPLVISGVQAESITASSATIKWQTNGPANSRVEYGTEESDLKLSKESATYQSSHSITLTGLGADTVYYYKVVSVMEGAGEEDDWARAEDADNRSFVTEEKSTGGGTGGGGGGGGGGGLTTVSVNGFQMTGTLKLRSSGAAISAATLKSENGFVTLKIPAGVFLKSQYGAALQYLAISASTLIPPAASPEALVLYYDFGPDGALFSPGINLSFQYDPFWLPEGVSEDSLYIAWWDGTTYQRLESTVDKKAHTVSALITHFSGIALMGTTDRPVLPPPSITPSLPSPVIISLTPGAALPSPTYVWEQAPGQTPTRPPVAPTTSTSTGGGAPVRPLEIWALVVILLAVIIITVLIVQRVKRQQ